MPDRSVTIEQDQPYCGVARARNDGAMAPATKRGDGPAPEAERSGLRAIPQPGLPAADNGKARLLVVSSSPVAETKMRFHTLTGFSKTRRLFDSADTKFSRLQGSRLNVLLADCRFKRRSRHRVTAPSCRGGSERDCSPDRTRAAARGP